MKSAIEFVTIFFLAFCFLVIRAFVIGAVIFLCGFIILIPIFLIVLSFVWLFNLFV